MKVLVPRTCTEILFGDEQTRQGTSRPLKDFRDVRIYVLLGDPGAGKTTAFKSECDTLGDSACLVTARDFLALDENNHPEWCRKTLFIDGLDEIRAGESNAATPFDQVRQRLDRLRPPRLRLSCRAADWLGSNDQKHLEKVVTGGEVTVLSLDKLSDSSIEQILESSENVGINTSHFIEEAKQRGMEELIRNPLTLKLLIETIAPGGRWPESRLEVFEKACLQMTREHNEEHVLAASPQAPSELLEIAGRLCAIQLISGIFGYAQHANQATADCPTTHQCGSNARQTEQALKTQLFTSTEGCVVPIHRHLAEFVGARYLSQIISGGLPARRVLSLMSGGDGNVVTELRGLAAWLAAQCAEARIDLIERDPVGVGRYGDISGYSHEDKRALLESLGQKTNLRSNTRWTEPAFGPLATPRMESEIRRILASPSREKGHQELTGFVLAFLPHGQALPGLSEILSGMVRDNTRWPYINMRALDAFIHCAGPGNSDDELKALLADICQGTVLDPDYELLGTLLSELYPESLPPSKIFDCLTTGGNGNLIGQYARFWETDLCDKSSDDQIIALLNHLSERFTTLRPALEHHDLRSLPAKLLARHLHMHEGRLDTERLYNWLGMDAAFNSWDVEPLDSIRSWLEQHPDTRKDLVREGLERHSNSNVHEIDLDFNQRFYCAEVPPDFGIWCLNEARTTAAPGSPAERYLLDQAVRAHRTQVGNTDLSLAILEEHAKTNETLREIMAPPPETKRTQSRPEQKKRSPAKDELLAHIRANETDLRENRANPSVLFHMARVYFGHFSQRDGGNPGAIRERLQGDAGLADSVLRGLRRVADRQDVPIPDQILDLRKQGKISYFSIPFLAALAEIERTESEDPSQWDEDRIRKALLFYYATPHGNYRPRWYRNLLEARPEVVADMQVRFAIPELQAGREHIYKLWEMAHDKAHSQVARLTGLPLLRAFPARCGKRQLKTLAHLLWAAIQHAETDEFLKLIKKKTSQASATIAQRVYWLAAGSTVLPEEYSKPLQDFVLGKQGRTEHLAEFLRLDDPLATGLGELPVSTSGIVVLLVGRYAGPGLVFTGEDGPVTPRMEASDLVHKYIRHLAASDTRSASETLGELLNDPALSPWHDILLQASEDQQAARRDAEYRHPDINRICQTLDGGAPANAADLWALLTDRLDEIGVQISYGNAGGRRPCWNEDEHRRPTSPKHEDSCRDAILDRLDRRLPQSIDLQPDGHYARDKRADIRVWCQGFNVPVEIKKNSHPDLWSAAKDQLIKKYAIDPHTDGYGIYLVLWFGKDQTQPPPSGLCPADPESLRQQLSAALSESEARKISVRIIDVSKEGRDSLNATA
ncbi:MAG: hypothetical protein OXC38_04230 [Gammaproteobacteria bacterium]|nr:hypothetical protein [Gammaproteobacteria bacterium]